MQKRGLSTVITTLLIILVSLVAVGVLWVVVRNILKTGTEGVGLEQFSLSAKIMNVLVDNNSNNISLTVKRNVGKGDLVGVSFVFLSNAGTEVITRNVSLKELEQAFFNFHLNTSVSDLISVSIVPLINQNEKQTLGIALDKYNLGGSQSPFSVCTPSNCTFLGHQCGTWNNGSCSGTLNCGTCSGGQTCNSSGRCVAGSCTPTTCSALGYTCGTAANGTCSGNLNCGNCTSGYNCVTGSCVYSCTPQTCSSLGYTCGSWANGTCGGTLNCGTCSSGYNCNSTGRCVDSTPPTRSNGAPSGTLPSGTTQANVSLNTNENAICRASMTAGTSYSSMVNLPATGGISHSGIATGLTNGQTYTYYIRCNDSAGNVNTDDYAISFSVAAASCTPQTCASLGYTCGSGYANGTCSGTLNCGSCSSGYNCVGGNCVLDTSCTPTTCSALGYTCGSWANGTCSSTLNCGTCGAGYTCVSGNCVPSTGTYYYVRAGATGANNGADWTNAYTELPGSLVSGIWNTNLQRGATYYIADGDYSSRTLSFYTTESGTQYITIKKATQSEHGTDTGWSSSYGDGIAYWGSLTFARSYYKFNGATGGGPGSWTSNYGFEIYFTPTVNTNYISIGKGGSSPNVVNHIEISHLKVGGPYPPTAGYGRGVYLSPVMPAKSNIIFSYNYFHDCGDTMMSFYNDVSDILLEYNRFERTASSETSHGTGLELNDISGMEIKYNQFVDIIGSGIIGGYNTASDHVLNNINIHGNLFFNTPAFTPPSAWNGILYTVSNCLGTVNDWSFHHNTIYSVTPTAVGPGSCESHSNCVSSGHTAYNNLFYTSQAVGWSDMSHSYNAGDVSVSETGFQLLTSNPFVNAPNGDLHLVSNTNPGMTLSSIYQTDLEGSTRSTWTRGAYEF